MTNAPDRFVLYYHQLERARLPSTTGGAAEQSLVVDVERFASHLDAITGSGRQVVGLDDALADREIDQDQVVITFDDGFRSDFDLALPCLLERGMTATSYVIAGKIDVDSDYMTFDQLREMHACGMVIGSHTMTHPWLTQISAPRMRAELVDSKKLLEDKLGFEVKHFCLPGGHYNQRILDEAKSAGYQSIASCEVGPLSASGPMCLSRFEIRRNLTAGSLLDTFEPAIWRRLQSFEAKRARLRRLLGLRVYSVLRATMHRVVSIER